MGQHRRVPEASPPPLLGWRGQVAWVLICGQMLMLVSAAVSALRPANGVPVSLPGAEQPAGQSGTEGAVLPGGVRPVPERSGGTEAAQVARRLGASAPSLAATVTPVPGTTPGSVPGPGTTAGPPAVTSKPVTSGPPPSTTAPAGLNVSGMPECSGSSWSVRITASLSGHTASEATVYSRRADQATPWEAYRMSGGPTSFSGSSSTEPNTADISWYVSARLTSGGTVTSSVYTTTSC